jgi:ubiquinone/menaquinone biosynthesis C-methylase UbiE
MAKLRDSDQLAVRTTAVEHHHADADRFMRWYSEMAQSRFANAFAYGRHKVDVLLDRALKELSVGAQILDVGCGTGEYVRRLADLGFQVSGLEPAAAMRQAAIEKNPGRKILDGIATQIPFPDETFDFVICIEVLRYLHRSDVDQALREMRRVLKPGGRMFLTMVNRYALDGFYIAYHARKMMAGDISAAAPHCEFVTPAEVDEQVRQAGFSAAVHTGVLFGPMRILYKISTRLARKLAPVLEPIDDAIAAFPAMTRFTGHLVTVASR